MLESSLKETDSLRVDEG
jgi:hypothetical protein